MPQLLSDHRTSASSLFANQGIVQLGCVAAQQPIAAAHPLQDLGAIG